MSNLVAEIEAFFAANYPGSDLARAYEYVSIPSSHGRVLAPGAAQQLADELTRGTSWVIMVGPDPTPHVTCVRAAHRDVFQQSDYTAPGGDVPQHFLELRDTRVDLAALFDQQPTEKLLIVDPESMLVLEYNKKRLHAPSAEALASVVAAHPDWFR